MSTQTIFTRRHGFCVVGIEQPKKECNIDFTLNPDQELFFVRGYANFGAEYGIRITVKEWTERLCEKYGIGNLILEDNVYYFQLAEDSL